MKKAKKAATKTKSVPKKESTATSPSTLIDAKIKGLGDWRGEMLARVRAIIRAGRPRRGRDRQMAKTVEPCGRAGVGA